MAERTGIEPATPGVTGQYSNHLNYRSYDLFVGHDWWVLQGLNLRPTACKAVALPTELNTRANRSRILLSRPILSNKLLLLARRRHQFLNTRPAYAPVCCPSSMNTAPFTIT